MDIQHDARTGAEQPEAVHHLVGEQSRCRPDALAVVDLATDRHLTYRELWHRAGGLAARLQATGVGRGDVCGVALSRSADLVVAMLAVARAGGCYVPLDTGAPRRRSAAQLTDSMARCLIAAPEDRDHASALVPGLTVVDVVRECDTAPHVSDPEISGDDPLYVNFTSGTSGRPKAVVVPHRAVRHLANDPTYCHLEPGDRVGNAANPAFDATTFEVWTTLVAGGTVVVLPPVATVGLERWTSLLRTAGIDALFLTTSLFHVIAQEQPEALGTLKTLLVGGEALNPEAARRVLASAPPGRLVNVYGPTEATTFATYYDLTPERLDRVERVPIGRAIQHTTLHVLDPDLRPVADGERGELCIGGPGVALGYLGRPGLTTERFVTLPGAPGLGPVYRTGDVVRKSPGGLLEIFGRFDRQVKLRGFRVELEEIERAALASSVVVEAAVEKVGEGASAALVGFVVPVADSGSGPGTFGERLQSALVTLLPDYMLPARWIVLDRLPLGPTGKTDRAALLRQIAAAGPEPGEDAPSSREGLSDEVRRIWCDVLSAPSARLEDNFIETGGNSILAIQLASRISEAVSAELGPTDVLLATDLAELIDAVRASVSAQS
ncbi:non-ribosomal peptide synthetase [Streptomyces sp. PTM05]|uniref:Non-ribosomal peptide synthetase n=1 Tax=Streptantibioticus parmotrematis TaxID=2873249 RepID=A0ABS7QNG4_9ACTN|nr:non-ribosomal peptide synthetase [Streptantibioticus parmotrematis]MBY8884721.1 non-ribosomal peptide synthetase [Streptantibioticus parmotrematis]